MFSDSVSYFSWALGECATTAAVRRWCLEKVSPLFEHNDVRSSVKCWIILLNQAY